jgi:hypothetical protein
MSPKVRWRVPKKENSWVLVLLAERSQTEERLQTNQLKSLSTKFAK